MKQSSEDATLLISWDGEADSLNAEAAGAGAGAGAGGEPSLLTIDGCLARSGLTPAIKLITFVLCLGNAADAVEILGVGYILNVYRDSDGGELSSEGKELLAAAVFLGMLVGGLVCGVLSDKIGRKPCLLVSLGLNGIAGGAAALAPNSTILILCRVVAGIGVGGSVPSVFTMGAEIFPPARRGPLLSVIASFWMVGAIFTATVAWIMLGDDLNHNRILQSSWRAFIFVTCLPALCTCGLTAAFVPESPRFLLAKNRIGAAALSLSRLTGVTVSPTRLYTVSTESSDNSSIGSMLNPLKALLSPPFSSETLVLCVIWFTLSFGSYGISAWITVLFDDIGLSNVYGSSFLYAVANIPGNVVSILFVDQIGRKRLLAWAMSLAAVSAVGFAFGTSNPAVVILCACLFNAFSVAGWNMLDTLSAENFPTSMRTSSMGLMAAAGRIGSVCAQFVNGELERNVPVLLFVTSGLTLLGGLASVWLKGENNGEALDDIRCRSTSELHSHIYIPELDKEAKDIC